MYSLLQFVLQIKTIFFSFNREIEKLLHDLVVLLILKTISVDFENIIYFFEYITYHAMVVMKSHPLVDLTVVESGSEIY